NPVVALTRVRLKDTPRRFSCEAPVRARPVPTIKPIVQTQSLEKSVSKQPAISSPKVSFRPDSSFKAFTPLESGPTTKEQPRTSKDIEKSAPKPIQPTKAFTVISQVTIERKKTAERKEILKEKTNDSNDKVPPVDKNSSKANSDGDIGGNSETEASDLRPLGKTISALYARIMKTDVGTRVVFKEVQSFATPAKVREDVPQDMVVSWVAGIVVHAFTFDLLKLIRTQGIPDSDSCMHKVELDFVRVLLSVDKVRRELTGQPSLVKTTVVPTIMRMICKYGHALHSSESMFPPDSPVFGILSPILIKSMLPLPYLHSVTRIMCSLCRMVGSGR
uniref:Uncharacterized protein n=1 Tax=Ciona savignyi TaxID=51511 RepID=H2Z012_CIOSA